MFTNPDAAGVTKVFDSVGTLIVIYPGRWLLRDLPSTIHAKLAWVVYVPD